MRSEQHKIWNTNSIFALISQYNNSTHVWFTWKSQVHNNKEFSTSRETQMYKRSYLCSHFPLPWCVLASLWVDSPAAQAAPASHPSLQQSDRTCLHAQPTLCTWNACPDPALHNHRSKKHKESMDGGYALCSFPTRDFPLPVSHKHSSMHLSPATIAGRSAGRWR